MRRILIFCVLAVAAVLQGCYPLNPSVMLKTDKNFKYSDPPKEKEKAYTISPNDIIEFRLFSNDGFKLVDLTSLEGNVNLMRNSTMTYLVDVDGQAKLPILGRVSLKGLTIREAEAMLEEKYAAYYNKPFAIVKVSNRRIIVFPGHGGTAKVLDLVNENTTILEALAMVGGIQETGRSNRIKLIRGDLKNPQVYHIDLRTIEGMKKADFIVQSNDIIYVEPIPDYTRGIVARISPIISLLSSGLVLYSFVRFVRNDN